MLSYNELYQLYVVQGLSIYDIAKLKGTRPWWLYDRLRELGIPRTLQHPSSLERHKQAMKGRRVSPLTEIKKGEHRGIATEFKQGNKPSPRAIEASHYAQNRRPNQVEVRLLSIIEKTLPGEYQYTGDGSFLINGICPDFVNCNGKKKVIEVFGDYWHSDKKVRSWKETELGRIMQYRHFGFDCLILWEKDILHKPENELATIIKIFHKNRCKLLKVKL
ncbi:MAG: hypothetical protein Q7T57_06295 [Dehalococcoidales bacterium]|nr:hypothetical protein [Dehalococcoidales bacterium]